ncbi:MAG: DUF58 domain-containing protein [Pirellula sp.]
MTSRSRWLALMCLIGLVVGIVRVQPTLSWTSLSILLWMLWEWSMFQISVTRELAHLKIQRSINGRSDPTGVLWAGRTIQVVLEWNSKPAHIGRGRCIRDVVPENLDLESLDQGNTDATRKPHRAKWNRLFKQIVADLFGIESQDEPINQFTTRWSNDAQAIRYRGEVRAAGELVFPGVRIEFHDAMRMFRRDRFIQHLQTFRVLPQYSAIGDATPNVKRMNAIPRQGIHRQQRAGVGFELLELREYVEGDPPKAIAWKASARRDKLMTRQYESEVPLRVQLIVDGTASTRIGGFGMRLLDQMTHTAASVAHSVTAVGDAIGAYLVDDVGSKRIRAVSGTTGFYGLMRALGEFSTNRLPPSTRLSAQMLETAYAVLSERHPELLDLKINPSSLNWLGLLNTRSENQRIQLTSAMAHMHGLSIHRQVAMLADDTELARRIGIFLSDCGMPWIAPIVAGTDASSFQSPTRIPLLTQSVMSAISNAHDNEVFVIVAELLGNTALRETSAQAMAPKTLEALLQALGIAKAKHHRVAVICPSPTLLRPKPVSTDLENNVVAIRMAAEHVRLRELALPLQRRLSKLGIPMTISGEPKATRMVLSEIEIARSGRLTCTGRGR